MSLTTTITPASETVIDFTVSQLVQLADVVGEELILITNGAFDDSASIPSFTGTLVHYSGPNDTIYKVGGHSDAWAQGDFEKYNGAILIQTA